MEIRHLRYFRMLAQELHFGRAAKRLFISQPPLSRQIRELEEELEVQLFIRNNKRVILTDAGKYYLAECEQLLNNLEKAKQQSRQIHLSESSVFNIGYISSISKKKLSELLKRIKKNYPLLQIHLFETSSHKQLDALEQGKLDIGIVRAPIMRPLLTQVNLYEDGFVLAVCKDTVLVDNIKDIDLSSASFISYNSEYAPVYHQKFLEICARLHFTPTIIHECNTIPSILDLVAYGVGIAIVPKTAIQDRTTSDIHFLEIGIASDITTRIIMTSLINNPSNVLLPISDLVYHTFK